MKKKWLLLSVFLLVVAVLGTVALASDLFTNVEVGDYTFRIRGDEGVLRQYTGSEKILELPESFVWDGETYPVRHIGKQAFSENASIESVLLHDNIRTIGDGAFSQCGSLSRVEFSGDAPEMGTGVFDGASTQLKLLYAHDKKGFTEDFPYEAQPVYYVEYKDYLSEGGTLPEDHNHYALGDSVQAQTNEGNLVRTGHAFKGWTTDPAGQGTLILEGDVFQVTEQTGTLYPYWEKNKYTVTWVSRGGSAVADTVVEHGDLVARPQDPQKKGAHFVRWTLDEKGEQPWSFDTQTVTGESSLYAQWLNIPSVPGGLKSSSAGIDKIKIQWNAAANGKSYEVYRKDESSGTFVKIGETASTSYTDGNRHYQTPFQYKVKATAKAFGITAESELSAAVSGKAELTVPSGFAAIRKEPQSVALSWSATPGAAGYEVYGSSSSNGSYTLLGRVTGTSYTDPSGKWNEGHYYKVRAYHPGSGAELFGDFTSVKGFYRVGDQLADYLSSLSNRNSINETAKRLRGGTLSNACVYFTAEALRRVGVPIRTTMGSIDHLLPYLTNNGWIKERDYTQLRKGDICFTRDSNGDPNGRPTHAFIFMGWVNPGDYTLAYICDNQSPYYDGEVLHTRYILERHEHNGSEKEAFSFFMSLR